MIGQLLFYCYFDLSIVCRSLSVSFEVMYELFVRLSASVISIGLEVHCSRLVDCHCC